MRMKSEDEVADDFEHHFAENSGHYLDPRLINEAAGAYENWSPILKTMNFTDPELITTITERAGPTLQWLKGFGVRFDFQPSYFITTCTTRISPVGGGLALIEALAAAAEKKNATFFYKTTARGLLQEADGAVTGVSAVGPGNQAVDFRRECSDTRQWRVRRQLRDAGPLSWPQCAIPPPSRARRLLQQGRRHPHGARHRCRAGGRLWPDTR